MADYTAYLYDVWGFLGIMWDYLGFCLEVNVDLYVFSLVSTPIFLAGIIDFFLGDMEFSEPSSSAGTLYLWLADLGMSEVSDECWSLVKLSFTLIITSDSEYF